MKRKLEPSRTVFHLDIEAPKNYFVYPDISIYHFRKQRNSPIVDKCRKIKIVCTELFNLDGFLKKTSPQ